jgi:hypothetical protein
MLVERVRTRDSSVEKVALKPAAMPFFAPAGDLVMARPEGSGRALTAYRMPIEGRDEWLAAAARHLA